MTFKGELSDTLQAQWTRATATRTTTVVHVQDQGPEGHLRLHLRLRVLLVGVAEDIVNTGYDDLLIAYQVDPAADDPNADPVVDPYSGNVTFIPDPNNNMKGLPLTITALDPYFKGPGCAQTTRRRWRALASTNACTG